MGLTRGMPLGTLLPSQNTYSATFATHIGPTQLPKSHIASRRPSLFSACGISCAIVPNDILEHPLGSRKCSLSLLKTTTQANEWVRHPSPESAYLPPMHRGVMAEGQLRTSSAVCRCSSLNKLSHTNMGTHCDITATHSAVTRHSHGYLSPCSFS